MTLPSFIGIGAQKAGTTWLYDMLAQNPSVWLPPLKEVHFFDRMNPTPEQKRNRSEHIEKIASRIERGKIEKGSAGKGKVDFLRSLVGDHIFSKAWYESIFAHPDAAGKITGEITPSYLDLSREEVARVADMLPHTKFIAVIREPFSRTLSQIKMGVARSDSAPETDAEWEYFIDKINYHLRGNYAESIALWQSFFGPERLLLLPFSLIRNDPARLLARIEEFIGAEHFDGYKALTEQIHKTKEVEVPEWVRRRLEEMTAPQRDYLINAFGQEFYDQTR